MALKGFIELLRLQHLAESRQQTAPQTPQWQGVAFSIAGMQFVAPIGEVTEVIASPQQITPVPLSKSWLLGIANVRGQLLPIMDLAKFLNLNSRNSRSHTPGAAYTALQERQKVLVIRQQDISVGLLVDAVTQIKKFLPEQYVAKSLPTDSPFLAYNHGQFVADDQQQWPVFMPSLLIEDPRFLEARI
ncbi:chemotaxis protein CheW [Psychrobacter sp. FDAARGOS_221]|uniref:chemotaxis protein CheW n=1 Tax=Psychrobacter sp. FDAARGOS_221 TaxID=1975705 RepID=UPI000BB55C67|nr:chemotaxis protein CheW [Psychrobacter sp. FDAARGOS_221]PNK60994.1 chemotaxis protein CheW [Psychrobacter sp. FDAARGOS_221]